MKQFLSISAQIVVITILILSFIVLLGIAFITYRYPNTVISFIQDRFIQEEEQPKVRLKALGVLGDSQSDEYRADDNRGSNFPSTTLNWVEQLVQERGVNVGEWGNWQEPRRTGYKYNWARTGATAASLIESGQHTGLAEQAKNGEVNVVIIYIGANDFSPYITHDGYEAIYNGELTDAQIERKINLFVADVTTAIDVVQKGGAEQILLVTVPDWGNHIGIKLAFPDPLKRLRVREVIVRTNRKLEKVAQERGIPTVDPNRFFSELSKESGSAKPIIGGQNLEYLYLNNNPENVFLQDGVHTGTAMNGLFLNYMLERLNPYLENPIPLLSEQEIMEIAGIK